MHRRGSGDRRGVSRSCAVTYALTGYAAYVPGYRLAGADVGLRHGERVVASFDEDSTTMAVAAAAGRERRARP